MSVQTQSLAAGAEGDRRAAQLAAGSATLGEIAAKFDPPLSIEQARAAIARGRQQLTDRAPKPAPPSKPQPQPAQEQKRSVPLETDELLAWAQQDGPPRARTVAARVRAQLALLAQLHDEYAATDVLRKTIAVLERQLASARTELRQMTSGKPAPRKAESAPAIADATPAVIRAWARENGYEVSGAGFVPKAIVEAYRRAHAEGEGAQSC